MNKRRDNDPSAVFSRGGRARPVGPRPSVRGPVGRGPKDHEARGDEFTPPQPKNPVAGAKPGLVLGGVLLVGGILALVIFPFLPVSFPGWATPALIGVIVAGIAVLFLQMPTRKSARGDGAQL